MPVWSVPALIVGLGLILGAVALVLWRRSQRIAPEAIFRVLDTESETAGTEHVEFPPLDLHQPIFGEAAWRAIRTHAEDAAYLNAVQVVRERHGDTGHPMALSNLLRETMAEGRIGFREAMLRLAARPGEAEPDAAWRGPVLDEAGRVIDPEDVLDPATADAEASSPSPVPVGGGRIIDVDDAGELRAAGAASGLGADPDCIIDLSRPIGREEWAIILSDAERHGYRDAAEAVQARYRTVIDRMLLPNTLRDLVAGQALTFAEAMIRAARDDRSRSRTTES